MAEPVKTDEAAAEAAKPEVVAPVESGVVSSEPVAVIETSSDEESEDSEAKEATGSDGKSAKPAKRPARPRTPRKPKKPKE
jgi:hypothetical protein